MTLADRHVEQDVDETPPLVIDLDVEHRDRLAPAPKRAFQVAHDTFSRSTTSARTRTRSPDRDGDFLPADLPMQIQIRQRAHGTLLGSTRTFS